jgi:tetratricopeptide (TPR) repeat protein
MFCVVGVLCVVMCGVSSCGWKEAKEVIATAERMDKTEHVVYDDTAAIAGVIRKLDNPVGRLFYRNTLGKAYYYMGRNLSLSDQIAEASECYIEADRLHIDDPIYQGRVNSCMGYICARNNNDSLALIFYERAYIDFMKSGDEWRYAQALLNVSEFNIRLHHFSVADSLLQIAKTYQLDSAYQARYYETQGLYFYKQQQYDSAFMYFNRGVEYWQSEDDKCFCYLKIMQIYFKQENIDSMVCYAKKIVSISKNPNYIANAYYCLMLEAKEKDNTQLLSQYSHNRTDAQKLLRNSMIKTASALPVLEKYLLNPHPLRWVWISSPIIIGLCIILAIGIWIYRKNSYSAREQLVELSTKIRTQEESIFHQQSLLELEQNRLNVLEKYPTPHKRWRSYLSFKKNIDPWMHDWVQAMDTLSLSEQEKIFCAISLIYPHMTDVEIADFICYSKDGIRVFKNRILKKLGVTSSNFVDFLRKLSVSK